MKSLSQKKRLPTMVAVAQPHNFEKMETIEAPLWVFFLPNYNVSSPKNGTV